MSSKHLRLSGLCRSVFSLAAGAAALAVTSSSACRPSALHRLKFNPQCIQGGTRCVSPSHSLVMTRCFWMRRVLCAALRRGWHIPQFSLAYRHNHTVAAKHLDGGAQEGLQSLQLVQLVLVWVRRKLLIACTGAYGATSAWLT